MTSEKLLDRPLVPVAGPEDAESTYRAVRSHTDAGECRPVVVHVVTDTADRDSVEQQTQRAHDAFERFESLAAADGMAVDTELYHGELIAETILKAATEAESSAIVFCSRGGSAWFDLLAGGVRTSLLVKSDQPVVMLPAGTE